MLILVVFTNNTENNIEKIYVSWGFYSKRQSKSKKTAKFSKNNRKRYKNFFVCKFKVSKELPFLKILEQNKEHSIVTWNLRHLSSQSKNKAPRPPITPTPPVHIIYYTI